MMRNFINIVESQQGFVLDPKLDPDNYQITPSLGGASRWKAKVISANSASDGVKIGDWEEVGYIMISLTNNWIVPIARSDEHNTGYDVLYDLGLNDMERKYLPLFEGGGNYIYHASDMAKYAIACSKWIAWGGKDFILTGTNELTGIAMYASQVAKKKTFSVEVTEIAPIGNQIIAAMDKLATAFRAAGDDPQRGKRMFAMVDKFLKPFGNMSARTMVGIDRADFEAIIAKTNQAKADADIQSLEEAIFGFAGFKNLMHQRVREVIKDPRALWSDKTYSVWGKDLSLANSRLGRF